MVVKRILGVWCTNKRMIHWYYKNLASIVFPTISTTYQRSSSIQIVMIFEEITYELWPSSGSGIFTQFTEFTYRRMIKCEENHIALWEIHKRQTLNGGLQFLPNSSCLYTASLGWGTGDAKPSSYILLIKSKTTLSSINYLLSYLPNYLEQKNIKLKKIKQPTDTHMHIYTIDELRTLHCYNKNKIQIINIKIAVISSGLKQKKRWTTVFQDICT